MFEAILRSLFGRRLDMAAIYTGVVKSVSGSTLTVQPDDPRLPRDMVLPVSGSVPFGGSIQAGARVLIGWDDHREPYAMAWDVADDAVVTLGSDDSAALGFARVGDLVTVTTKVPTAIAIAGPLVNGVALLPPGKLYGAIVNGHPKVRCA